MLDDTIAKARFFPAQNENRNPIESPGILLYENELSLYWSIKCIRLEHFLALFSFFST